MPDFAARLPCRRASLVTWPARREGAFLLRNRQSGETFEIGAGEHFLLGRLDGRHSGEEICAAYAARFHEPLTAQDLQEFLNLAGERGLLQPPGALPVHVAGLAETTAPRPAPRPAPLRRWAARLVSGAAAGLRWAAGLCGDAAQHIEGYRLRRLLYVPRSDDVFIVTYPRSGTTWLQMILYQLTTDGRMDFAHIAEYCPWFERSLRSARGFETRPSPRLFKSHLPYRAIPKGPCKYLYVARDGRDVAVSYYHLCRQYNGFAGTFAEFFERFLNGQIEFGSWFNHIRGWWEHREDANVLWLTYEELSRDLAGTIRRIATFIGREPTESDFARIVERSQFDFMKQHEERFDPVVETLWEEGVQLKSFLRRGRVGESLDRLTAEQRARFDDECEKRLTACGIHFGGENAPAREHQ